MRLLILFRVILSAAFFWKIFCLRHQFFQPLWMTLVIRRRHALEDIMDVLIYIQVVGSGGFDQTVCSCVRPRPGLGIGKQPRTSVGGKRPYMLFGSVVRDRDFSVMHKGFQVCPLVYAVGKCLRKLCVCCVQGRCFSTHDQKTSRTFCENS